MMNRDSEDNGCEWTGIDDQGAANFAPWKHRDQRRKGVEASPYIITPSGWPRSFALREA